MTRGMRVRILLLGLVAAMALPGRVWSQASDRLWVVWINEDRTQCASTRQTWMAVSQDNPGGGGGLGVWVQANGYLPTFEQANAFAQLDALRTNSCSASTMTCPNFENYCCTVQVWRNNANGAMTITQVGQPPGAGFTEAVGPPQCGETAVELTGFDPFGASSLTLTSVPGVVVRRTPNGGFASAAGPVTIPTNPPVVLSATAMPPGRGTSIGCFKDPNNPFNLNGYLERSAQNTPQRCIDICRAKGFAYAGVEYSESCLCGNSYNQFGPANNCNMVCTGDRSQICGGYSSNSVYATGQ
jgi:hypothetical protein